MTHSYFLPPQLVLNLIPLTRFCVLHVIRRSSPSSPHFLYTRLIPSHDSRHRCLAALWILPQAVQHTAVNELGNPFGPFPPFSKRGMQSYIFVSHGCKLPFLVFRNQLWFLWFCPLTSHPCPPCISPELSVFSQVCRVPVSSAFLSQPISCSFQTHYVPSPPWRLWTRTFIMIFF